jgi:hypothetical protein
MADRSLKEYPQWGQHIKLQFFERRHPVHFIAPSLNSFPQRGHFNVVFIPFHLWFLAVLPFCCLSVLPLTPKPQHCSTAKLQHKKCSYIPIHLSKKFNIPPTPKAMGKITADIQRVFFNPLSLIIIKNWAIKG